MASPIATQKISTSSGVLNVPVFALSDVSYPAAVIQTPNGMGCYDLVDPTDATPLRVNTPNGVKGVSLVGSGSGTIANLVDFNNRVITNTYLVTVTEAADHIGVAVANNGHGVAFPITGLEPSKAYNVKVNIEMLSTVDDLVAVHIRNITKNAYISTSVVTASLLLNQKQTLVGSFSTNATLDPADVVHMQVVQSWRNSTHDPIEFNLYDDISLS
jgi:hypothetical protein